jgi:23S rRNA (uracil1939-C5)-methyltransferase
MNTHPIATIESVDHEGRGVARIDGKTTFINGALPGETVHARISRRKPNFDVAHTDQIIHESAQRVAPQCPHFGVCGGCSHQHQHWIAQVAVKQRVLEDCLERIGHVKPEMLLPPLVGVPWGYRHRARLSVRHVEKKGGVLVGFHERGSSFVADMRECRVLPKHVSDMLVPLRSLVANLSIRDRMPQIEVAVGDEFGQTVTALVFRNLEAFSTNDETLLKQFADEHRAQIYVQPKGPETATPLYPAEWTLAYSLPEFGVRFRFKPTEFTQVNPYINARLVKKAMTLLNPQPGERIGDLFCGLGNFSLPIATFGATVVGVEGSAQLVERAKQAAAENNLIERCDFKVSNLFEATPESIAALGPLDRLLIDPPRDGALEVCKSVPRADDPRALKKIVYVSCNPATLARDASVLVGERGYRMLAAGVANMFPHTAHVESIAVFSP